MKKLVITHLSSDDNNGDLAILVGLVSELRRTEPVHSVVGLSAELPLRRAHSSDKVGRSKAFGVQVVGTPVPSRAASGKGTLRWILDLLRAELVLLLMRRHKPLALRIARATWRPFFSALAEADWILAKGGSYLYADENWRDLPFLWRMLFPLRAAAKLDKPAVPVGISLGPFRTPVARWMTRRALLQSPMVGVREGLSLQTALGVLGLPGERVRLVPDVALLLPVSSRPRRTEQRDTLGLAIRAPNQFDSRVERKAYEEAFVGALTDFLELTPTGRAVLFSQVREDLPLAQRIASYFCSDQVLLIDDFVGPMELVEQYGSCTYLLTSRVHSVLLGALAGTPSVSIAFEPQKTVGTMALLGLSEWTLPSRHVTRGALTERLLDLASQRDEVAVMLRDRVSFLQQAARVSIAQLPRSVDWG
jgi:colanic acid/amylovoran biosynthesis protein